MNLDRVIGVCAIVMILFCAACSSVQAPPARHRVYTALQGAPKRNLIRSCPDRYDSRWDYFPEKVRFQYSTQLTVSYHRSYKVIDFIPNLQANLPLRYVLYQCGTPRPQGFGGATFIQVPVQRAVLNNPSFGSTVEALGVIDRLYGVNDLDAFTNETILKAGQEGRLHQLGTRGPSTIELATAIDTDVVFLFYSANPTFNLHPALFRLGVGAVALGDIFETSPLGRAEWLKFFALFFNEEGIANVHFDAAAQRYLELADRVSHTAERPSVLLGFASSRDTWTASGGHNALAQLVHDAGGRYFLQNDDRPAANLRMPFEKVMQLAYGASFWIGSNGLNRVPSKCDLIRGTPMLEHLSAVRIGHVFALDSNMLKSEALPFADGSLDKPDVLLSDFVSVLHPGLLPGYRPVFIRELL